MNFLSSFLNAGRCNNQKDAELLVAFGSDPGHAEDQQTHRQPLRLPGPRGQFCSYRGRVIWGEYCHSLCGGSHLFLAHLEDSGDSAVLNYVTWSHWEAGGAQSVIESHVILHYITPSHGGPERKYPRDRAT